MAFGNEPATKLAVLVPWQLTFTSARVWDLAPSSSWVCLHISERLLVGNIGFPDALWPSCIAFLSQNYDIGVTGLIGKDDVTQVHVGFFSPPFYFDLGGHVARTLRLSVTES